MPRGRRRKLQASNFDKRRAPPIESIQDQPGTSIASAQFSSNLPQAATEGENPSCRPTRAAKARQMEIFSQLATDLQKCEDEEMRSHIRSLNKLRRNTETFEEREKRLVAMRKNVKLCRAGESSEVREERLADMRHSNQLRKARESSEVREERLAAMRHSDQLRKARESSEVREERLATKRLNENLNKAGESLEDREERLATKRHRDKLRKAGESSEDREERLATKRHSDKLRKAGESSEDREERLATKRHNEKLRKAGESSEDREKRLATKRHSDKLRKAGESSKERSQRLEKMRNHIHLHRSNESNDNRLQRLEEQSRRNARRQEALQQKHLSTYKIAVTLDATYQSIGHFVVECIHCGALHFPEERVTNRVHRDSFGDCCLHGRIDQELPIFPNNLVRLFLRRHPLASNFHKKIRNLNASFALASFNVSSDQTISSRGIYSFTACGQIYHRMNMAVHPTQDAQGDFERPVYGQMYFLDPSEAINERLHHPLNHGVSRSLMELLETIIRSQNSFVQGFMMMREVEEEVIQRAATEGITAPHVRLVFMEPDGVDHRRFNVPSCNDICAVLTLNADQSFPEYEMVVHQRGKNIVTLKNTDKRVEPFTYPLFYPQGTFGFYVDLPLKTPYPSRRHLTRLEFAQYRIAYRTRFAKHLPSDVTELEPDLRPTIFNPLHFGGRLFQQYVVDTYIRVERDRLQWIRANQNKILAHQYTNVTNFLNELAEKKGAIVGEKIILPSTFPGSTRYYTEHFEDAMAIVRRLGSPDFFITMTCSPDWPEFKEAARIAGDDGITLEQQAQDRPDLIARIAKIKFDNVINDFDKNQIFGKISAYMYTIEFQKRGLPHMHLLLIMHPEDKIRNSEELDDIIYAEIPNDEDTELRQLVLKWMIHNPCGELNPGATCMVNKNGRHLCRFDFPKPFQDVSSLRDDEKPKYRRRYDSLLDPHNPAFSHTHAVYRKDINGHRITRDNRHVAPYNPYLLKKFQCHINVEYVGSIRAVKYLYKYIYKGHDCASIKIVENECRLNYNEANTYLEGRCITPPEACWRLLGNEIQKKTHVVQRLDIHLPGCYRVTSLDQAPEDIADVGQKYSTLEAYFKVNKRLKETEENRCMNGITQSPLYHFYWQMPEFFKWIGKSSEWAPRIRKIRVIGRIHNVNCVAKPELYHLRLLLYHVKDAASFDDLLIVGGTRYNTYKQACLARGLTYDDQQWVEGLQESASSMSPRAMRNLFIQILIFGSPENPKRLWDLFKRDLAEDFIREAISTDSSVDEAIKRAYRIIANKLNTESTEGRNFGFWVEHYGMDNIDGYENTLNHQLNEVESTAIGDSSYRLLNQEQTVIVDTILQAVGNRNGNQRCFFIDGPGGTGKSFIYKTLCHILRGRNIKVKCMAFTGIASILLPGGQTAHKTFGLKVPLTSQSISNIPIRSAKAQELAKIDVFLMDEAPMLPKYGLDNMDQLLRAIGNSDFAFGGKIIVFGGDFRQCLPVQPRANRSELINLSIKHSLLWHHFSYFQLTRNMRIEPEEEEFAKYILDLGNGDLPMNSLNEIMLPEDILSNGNLIDEVFGDCLANKNYEGMKDRAILAPLNSDVSRINSIIIAQLPGDYKTYLSYDTVKDQEEGALEFTPEFLNSIEIADLPPHELKLKTNTIVMLLRNLDVSEGLCNGTRLIVTELGNNIIKARSITGEHAGRQVHIPRITLDSSKSQLGCTMQRHQFPVRPAFAMTIHKSQGQTFDFVGVNLQTSVFMHGMLYVAFSRVKRRRNLRVHIPTENGCRARNIVWKEVLTQSDDQ